MHLRVKTAGGRFKVQLGTELVASDAGLTRSSEVRWTEWIPFDVQKGMCREEVEFLLRQAFPGAVVAWYGRPPRNAASRRPSRTFLDAASGDGCVGDGHSGDGHAGDGQPAANPSKGWVPVLAVPGREN